MRPNSLFGVLVLVLALGGTPPAAGAESAPYFVSLKSSEVYMREGPSEDNRIKWIYHRKGLPMEVIAAFDVWRRVRDMDGEVGWIHVALLSRDRMAVIAAGPDATVRRGEENSSETIAEAKPGAVGRLVRCGAIACEVKFDEAEGWIDRGRLWGIRDGRDY
jgi:SH3-like domain-containing protein